MGDHRRGGGKDPEGPGRRLCDLPRPSGGGWGRHLPVGYWPPCGSHRRWQGSRVPLWRVSHGSEGVRRECGTDSWGDGVHHLNTVHPCSGRMDTLQRMPVPHEWGRFTYWLSQGQNAVAVQFVASIILAVITAWYVIVTRSIMKATAQQASAALQPVLALSQLRKTLDDPIPTVLIQNPGDRPVVFLDVVIWCHPSGHEGIEDRLRFWDDEILAPGEQKELRLDFSKSLREIGVTKDACAFRAELVVSDLSRQAVIQYDYAWVLGRFTCKVGLPWRVRWKYFVRPWGWRYNRLKSRLSGK